MTLSPWSSNIEFGHTFSPLLAVFTSKRPIRLTGPSLFCDSYFQEFHPFSLGNSHCQIPTAPHNISPDSDSC